MLKNPETLQSLSELAVALVSLIITVAVPMITARIYQFTGIKIEEKHMKALHEAINSWVGAAIMKGAKEANAAMLNDLVTYLERSVPDAMKFFIPSASVLQTIANKFFQQKLAAPATVVQVDVPAAADAAAEIVKRGTATRRG